jgi:hypothetical protein
MSQDTHIKFPQSNSDDFDNAVADSHDTITMRLYTTVQIIHAVTGLVIAANDLYCNINNTGKKTV